MRLRLFPYIFLFVLSIVVGLPAVASASHGDPNVSHVTQQAADQYGPKIFGTTVVWEDWRNNFGATKETMLKSLCDRDDPTIGTYGFKCRSDIYIANLASLVLNGVDADPSNDALDVTNETTVTQLRPSIWMSPDAGTGKIVWEDFRNVSADAWVIGDSSINSDIYGAAINSSGAALTARAQHSLPGSEALKSRQTKPIVGMATVQGYTYYISLWEDWQDEKKKSTCDDVTKYGFLCNSNIWGKLWKANNSDFYSANAFRFGGLPSPWDRAPQTNFGVSNSFLVWEDHRNSPPFEGIEKKDIYLYDLTKNTDPAIESIKGADFAKADLDNDGILNDSDSDIDGDADLDKDGDLADGPAGSTCVLPKWTYTDWQVTGDVSTGDVFMGGTTITDDGGFWEFNALDSQFRGDTIQIYPTSSPDAAETLGVSADVIVSNTQNALQLTTPVTLDSGTSYKYRIRYNVAVPQTSQQLNAADMDCDGLHDLADPDLDGDGIVDVGGISDLDDDDDGIIEIPLQGYEDDTMGNPNPYHAVENPNGYILDSSPLGSAERPLVVEAGVDASNPDVDGANAVYERSAGGGLRDIWVVKNVASVSPIKQWLTWSSGNDEANPAISGNWAVWEIDDSFGNTHIQAMNIATRQTAVITKTESATLPFVYQKNPDIFGDRVVFENYQCYKYTVSLPRTCVDYQSDIHSTRLPNLTLSGGTTITHGASVTLAGSLKTFSGSALSGKPVQIQQKTASGSWSTIANRTTNSAGSFSAALKPTQATTYRAYFAGGAGYAPMESTQSTIKVRLAATLWFSSANLPAGKSVKIVGTVQPSHPGTAVYLQRYNPTTKQWVALRTTTLGGASNFTYWWTPPKGAYSLRLVTAAHLPTHEANLSSTKKLSVFTPYITTSKSSFRVGNWVKIGGWTSPSTAGMPVYIQRYNSSTKRWVWMGTTKMSSSSGFAYWWKPARGTHYVRYVTGTTPQAITGSKKIYVY